MVDLPEKVSLYMILVALVQNLIFQDASHLGFGLLAKNAEIFGRDMGAKIFFIKGQ